MSGINDRVDGAFVLSVGTFHDRIAHMKREMARHGIRFEFVFEHDAATMDEALIRKTFSENTWLGRPAQSLVLKHIEVWRRAAKTDEGIFLIFEDDVVLRRDFAARLSEVLEAVREKRPGWLISLEGADGKVPRALLISNAPIYPYRIANTGAYLVDAASCRKRLAWLERTPVNEAADHLLRQIDRECGIAQYWATTPLVEQGSLFGLFDTTLDSDRMRRTALANRFRYRWRVFRLRTAAKFFARLTWVFHA